MAVLTLKEVKVTKNLEKFAVEVLPADIQSTIQYVFLSELEVQQRLGAKPSSVLVDSGRGQLVSVKKRAQAFFSNSERLIQATKDAWDLLVRLTRVKSGKARGSYALYANRRLIGGREDIEAVVKALRPGDFVSIVGPGVEYGRRLFWDPMGKARKKRKKVAVGKDRHGRDTTVYSVSTIPLHTQVDRILTRKYRDLIISDMWIALQHGSGMQGERWPAISLAMKTRNAGV